MALVQFYITRDVARRCLATIGDMGCVHFRDANANVGAFQRVFIDEMRRFDTSERQLEYLRAQLASKGVRVTTAAYDAMVREPSLQNRAEFLPSETDIDDMMTQIENHDINVKHLVKSYEEVQTRLEEAEMHRVVLFGTSGFFGAKLSPETNQLAASGEEEEDMFHISSDEEDVAGFHDNTQLVDSIRLESGQSGTSASQPVQTGETEMNILGATMNFICGTIDTQKFFILERICWRALRGNLYINHIPIEESLHSDKNDGELEKPKCIFMIFTHGQSLLNKCKRIVDSLDGKIYPISADPSTHPLLLNDINQRIDELASVKRSCDDLLTAELKEVAISIERWIINIRQEKSIYSIMNLLNYDETRRCLIGEGWIPVTDLMDVKKAMKEITNSIDRDLNTVLNVVETNRTPPTFHRTNKFTESFQSIIDAYGIATYQEVNPGLATIVTFPFMFAIMFGDLGHGFLLFLAALTLVIYEKSIGKMNDRDEIFDMAYTGRYILLLMGFFSMYTGLMYNDLFSKAMTLFPSGWQFPEKFNEGDSIVATFKFAYPFGIDSAWHGTENNLLFMNSYKMKLSILMGFIHMSYSYLFSLANYKFFKSKIDIWGNFIPGLLFMQSLFGYLSLTIIYKWLVDWNAIGKPPPGLLNMLINMFLSPGQVAKDEQLYPGQATVQYILVLIALVCVPWLLLYKPLALKRQHNNTNGGITLGYSDIPTNDRRFSIGVLPSTGESGTNDLATDAASLFDDDNVSINIPSAADAAMAVSSLSPAPATGLDTVSSTGSTIKRINALTGLEEDEDPDIIEVMAHFREEEEGEEFEMGEIVVHQVIHTIEFCLNCVSHTASYLRLWALSLAHNQLSAVLWDMTIQNSFVPYSESGFQGSVVVFLLFGMWFVLTVAILVVMEGTSAMLHSLRLHWVEAMSKFFEGEGYAYEPFSFYKVIKDAELKDKEQ